MLFCNVAGAGRISHKADTVKFSKVVIISGNPDLAEKVCAHFRTHGTYIVLLEEPMVRLVEARVFRTDCFFVIEAVRELRPQAVVFAGCSREVLNEFTEMQLSAPNLVVIDEFDEQELSVLPGYKPAPFHVSSVACVAAAGDVVIVEDQQPWALIIAQNLVAAHGGAIATIPHVSSEQRDWFNERWRTWDNESGLTKVDARNEVLAFLRERLNDLNRDVVTSTTFITVGIPYGLLPLHCPGTHFYSFPLLGVCVLNGMMKGVGPEIRCPVAVLIEPGTINESEIPHLSQSFGHARYAVRKAIGVDASVSKATYLTQFMPADIIFYSSHCTEERGQRVVEEFTASSGSTHRIEYDRVLTGSRSPDPDKFEIMQFIRLVSLDWVSWPTVAKSTSNQMNEIAKEFMNELANKKDGPRKMKILKVAESEVVPASECLRMKDGPYMPMPQIVGGFMHPVVYNNSCSSSREFAARFVTKGASVYIGTSFSILTTYAFLVAKHFGEDVAKGRTIGHSLFRAQRKISSDLGYNPYIMHGYLFTSLRRPPPKTASHYSAIMKIGEVMRRYRSALPESDKQKTQAEMVKLFLENELKMLQSAANHV